MMVNDVNGFSKNSGLITIPEKLFRKALYLDPNHEEALLFLSLLAEKTGDIKEAKNLRQRIERLKNDPASHSSNS